jgi:hypothetical protein
MKCRFERHRIAAIGKLLLAEVGIENACGGSVLAYVTSAMQKQYSCD